MCWKKLLFANPWYWPTAVVIATHEHFPASTADGAVGLVAIIVILVGALQERVLPRSKTQVFLFLLLFIEFIFTCLWTTTDYQYVTDVPIILSLLPKQLAAWIFPLGKCSFHKYWVRYLLLEEIYHGKTFSGSSFPNVRIWDSLYYLVLFLISLWSGLFFHSLLHVDRQKYSVNNNNKSD